MNSLTATRKRNLRLLLEQQFEGNLSELARRAGVTKQTISNWLTPDNAFGEKACRGLERSLSLPVGRLDRGAFDEGPTVGLTPVEIELARRISRLSAGQQQAVRALIDGLGKAQEAA